MTSTLRVDALWRYPVKSMAGERVISAPLTVTHGLVGDRAYALLDVETGRIVSAKQPARWGSLLDHRARSSEERVEITLLDGSVVMSDAADADERLSAALGRAVRLVDAPPRQATFDEADGTRDHAVPLAVAAPRGTLFDFAPIHLVTTASLATLSRACPDARFDVTRFRPNLVLHTDDEAGFPENAWLGRTVSVGDARLCIVSTCPRCVMTTLAQQGLPADPRILKTIAAHNMQVFSLRAKKLPTVGVYATVIRDGLVRIGDDVRVERGGGWQQFTALARAITRAVRRR